VEVCQVVDQAKIALTLVQNWICKNKLIELKTQKFQKITISREPHFKSNPKKFTQKLTIFLLVIEFRSKFKISLLKCIEKY